MAKAKIPNTPVEQRIDPNSVPLKPVRFCPNCGEFSICELSAAQKAEQTDGTTHVCHILLDGCNLGFRVE